MTKVGILSLQGCVDPHIEMLQTLGVSAVEVKKPAELQTIDRLIIPGGESSTMLKLAKLNGIFDSLKEFTKTKPVWGICAGAILLAKETINPEQESLKAIDIRATRNYYGSQLNSFKAQITLLENKIDVDFIRAPKLEALSSEVEVLASYQKQDVCMKQGSILVSAFHTELGDNAFLHKFFLEI